MKGTRIVHGQGHLEQDSRVPRQHRGGWEREKEVEMVPREANEKRIIIRRIDASLSHARMRN